MDSSEVLGFIGFFIIYLLVNMLLLCIVFFWLPLSYFTGWEYFFFRCLQRLFLIFIIWLNFYFWKEVC